MASLNDVPDIGISREKFKNKRKAEKELRIAQQVVSRLVDLSHHNLTKPAKTMSLSMHGKLYPWDFCF